MITRNSKIMSISLMLFALANFINLVNSQEKSIFLLAGQSNMSGQSGVVNSTWDGFVPPECSPNPSILKFDANMKWVEAEEPLHDGIEVNVTNGIGPGIAFANSLLSKNLSNFGVIGLVPCARSGHRIMEWQKGTYLYNQLIERAEAALEDGGAIRALLWYQGESDSVRPTDANVYKGRFQQFITDLRADLEMPELLIIEVVLASGGPLIEIVRQAQLNSTDIPNVKCVDGNGLPLQSDNLHLTTLAQVRLGDMLADAFLTSI